MESDRGKFVYLSCSRLPTERLSQNYCFSLHLKFDRTFRKRISEYLLSKSADDSRVKMSSLSNMFLFVLIHQQLKIKQMNCFFSLFNKYMKRCDVHICNMISISFVQYVNFPLSARRFFRLGTSFFFTTMKHKEKFSS